MKLPKTGGKKDVPDYEQEDNGGDFEDDSEDELEQKRKEIE